MFDILSFYSTQSNQVVETIYRLVVEGGLITILFHFLCAPTS
jgi:hypothetical protein